MNRIHLRKSLRDPLDESLVRSAIVELARFACNGTTGRQKGDPVFERVTEGRQECWTVDGKRRCYSACGDLPHFVAWCAAGGVVDFREVRQSLGWINRAEAWGWRVGWNLIKLHAETGAAWFRHRKIGDGVRQATRPGDVWLIGEYGNEHGFVVESIEGDVVNSFDFGQFFELAGVWEHGGKARSRSLRPGLDGRLLVGDDLDGWRPLHGRLNMFAALRTADESIGKPGGLVASLVPDGVKGGIPDDNPYFDPFFEAD